MDTLVSQRGNDNWIYEKNRYRRDRCNADGSSSWRCVRRDCIGQRKKRSDGSSVEVTAHIHAPNNAKNDAECVKAAIRQRAVNTVERPRQIILQTTTGSSVEASQYLPAYSSLQRTINRKRKRENLAMPNPRWAPCNCSPSMLWLIVELCQWCTCCCKAKLKQTMKEYCHYFGAICRALLSPRIYLRVFVGAILSARYCLRTVVGALLSCALLSMNPHTHTHTIVLLFFWNLSGTTRVSRYQKG